jgi:hypothetical protein
MKKITCFSALLMLLASVAVSAAEVQVRVFERGGKAPLVGVAVCLGTPARISQFGARLTDEDGNAVFGNVPRATLLVTASKNGYKAEQKNMGASSSDRLLVISLPGGGGGVQCELGEAAVELSGKGLSLSRFAMNNGAAVTKTLSVTLDNSVTGQPTQYRASESPDFKGAEWENYKNAPAFSLSTGLGKKTVYFQVRRHATLGGANLETLSPVRTDSILLQ